MDDTDRRALTTHYLTITPDTPLGELQHTVRESYQDRCWSTFAQADRVDATLIREGDPAAQKYKGRSVAEQNSVDIAWGLFMDPKFSMMRHTICATTEELGRFRQLLVNLVMATARVPHQAIRQLVHGDAEKVTAFL